MADPLISTTEEDTVYRDHLLRVDRTQSPAGFRFVGEIDITNSVAIAHALSQAVDGQRQIHLDLTSLVFCDVSGLRALVTVAQAVTDRQILVHGLAPELERVVRLVGWSDQPSFWFCRCTVVRP